VDLIEEIFLTVYPWERAPRLLAILLRISLRFHLQPKNSKKLDALAGLFRTIFFRGMNDRTGKYYRQPVSDSRTVRVWRVSAERGPVAWGFPRHEHLQEPKKRFFALSRERED